MGLWTSGGEVGAGVEPTMVTEETSVESRRPYCGQGDAKIRRPWRLGWAQRGIAVGMNLMDGLCMKIVE